MMFFRKKKKNVEQAPQAPKYKNFELYRGAGFGGELRVESIILHFNENNKCEGIVNCGDFTPMGGGGFRVPIPDELIRNLTEEGLTELFQSALSCYCHTNKYFKITIPDDLKTYITDNVLKSTKE